MGPGCPARAEVLYEKEKAYSVAEEKANLEGIPYVIWWVMDKGYVVCSKNTRPSWFFVAEEATIYPE